MQAGNVLLVCLCLAVVIGISLAAVFSYASNQFTAVARSQAWNESLVLADAGVEDALQLLNKYADTGLPPTTWSSTATADNWQKLSASVLYVRRFLNGNQYDVYITNLNNKPSIRCTGTRVWRSAQPDVQRTVLVTTATSSLFQGALLAKNGVLLGGTVRVDSYNSQDPSYSTNGKYSAAKAKDGGNVATIASNMVAAVSVGGSVDVFGKVYTGPGDTIKVTGGGAVGSADWINDGNSGIESGWSQSDLNLDIPNAPSPPGAGLPLPSKSTYTLQGTTYGNSYLLNGGDYQANSIVSLTSTDAILVSGHVNLYLTKNFKMAGQSKVIIGTNSSLTIYAAADVDLSGGGVVNGTGLATNLTLYGLPTSQSIQYTGGSDFTGTIYAPQANLKLSGGGPTIYNLNGSAVANTITVQGKYEVHYDESLEKTPAGPVYYVTSWREL